MPVYAAPVSDTLFLLSDVFDWNGLQRLPGFADVDLATVETVLTEAARIGEEMLLPLNRIGDLEGCRRAPDGEVATPTGFKEAYRAYAAAGWIGLAAPAEWGGQGLPYTLAAIINAYSAAANMAFAMYPGLTQTAIAAIDRHAPADLKRLLLPKLCSGAWSGTMNLTEPQCGTDLGLITTRATPDGEGRFAVRGQKIFISAGEHDLCENIIHLVLARIDGAPAGTRGLSLFVVPKFEIANEGLGPRNRLSCGSIERKMGIHGNATCVMNYDGAKAWLIAEPNRGLHAMFTMMNEARLGVAAQGLAQSEIAYQSAAAYARERLQGRAAKGSGAPDLPADPIIVHPDVRRMLLTIRAFNEAAWALLIHVSLQADLARLGADEAERAAADDRLGLLTPVLKGVFSDLGFENAVLAQQVFGGHGYVADTGVEQFVRDARIAMIYEGANGIQALDLVGRKLPKDGGRALRNFIDEVAAAAERAASGPLQAFAESLKSALEDLRQATLWLMGNALTDFDNAGAASYDYMHLLGSVALGFMWIGLAEAARARKAAAEDPGEAARMKSKLALARFHFERLAPQTAYRLARIRAGAASIMAFPAEAF